MNYICNINCSYKTPSGYCGVTGGYETCQHRQIREVYGICSFDSNAMKSPNPHSGIYLAETARTLDMNGGCPACNQGGCLFLKSATPLIAEMER